MNEVITPIEAIKEVFADHDKFRVALKKVTTFGIWRPAELVETGESWPVPEEDQ